MTLAAFFSDRPELIDLVYGQGRAQRLQSALEFYPQVITRANFAGHAPQLQDLELIFSTWGMPALEEEQLAQLPGLKAVFYAAGSVQFFARPFLARGVKVISAWAANAIPVAQFTVGQIFLAAKGFFAAERQCRTPAGRAAYQHRHLGLFGTSVALLGAGMIGTRVIDLLRPHELNLLVYDPYLSDERAAALGVHNVALEEAFARAFVVSNHIPDLPETRGMLTPNLFERMPPNATFINTGRGATIDEAGLLAVLARRPDLTALLDVTYPEPPRPDSPIYQLENVLLTPHIAGNLGPETARQADCVIEEWQRLRDGQPLRYAVTLEMLKTMA